MTAPGARGSDGETPFPRRCLRASDRLLIHIDFRGHDWLVAVPRLGRIRFHHNHRHRVMLGVTKRNPDGSYAALFA